MIAVSNEREIALEHLRTRLDSLAFEVQEAAIGRGAPDGALDDWDLASDYGVVDLLNLRDSALGISKLVKEMQAAPEAHTSTYGDDYVSYLNRFDKKFGKHATSGKVRAHIDGRDFLRKVYRLSHQTYLMRYMRFKFLKSIIAHLEGEICEMQDAGITAYEEDAEFMYCVQMMEDTSIEIFALELLLLK